MSVPVTSVATPVGTPAVPHRVSTRRRVAVTVAGVVACALPLVFAVSLSRALVLGELPDHRFHQLTGQGLLLVALWLGGLLPQLRAGWQGRTPSAASAVLHLVFVVTGVLCTVAAPLGGAPFLLADIVVTGLLVQVALPHRAQLRTLVTGVRPASLTASLVLAAVAAPYVVDQLALQHAATGHHAANPHYFDMAWVVTALVVLALVASVAELGPLLRWAAAGVLYTGLAMVALDEGTGRGVALLAAGAALVAAQTLEARRPVREAAAGAQH